MGLTYAQFSKYHMDLRPLGIEKGEPRSHYFCTPKGAKLIGWAGVDGIHFCFLRKYGEMVFAVSPMNAQKDYVHPLAASFEDFLRLLLACGDAAALEQLHGWSRSQFDDFLLKNPPVAKHRELLDKISAKCPLTPMPEPYAYVMSLQAGFDYGGIPYQKDYYEWKPEPSPIPEWKVYFGEGFWGHRGRDHAGREISVDKHFTWGGEAWYVPAVYSCTKGLVIDLCLMVEPEREKEYIDKWYLMQNELHRDEELRERCMTENPLNSDFRIKIEVNKKLLRESCGYGTSWLPASCLPEGVENEPAVKSPMEHYALNVEKAWSIRRICFPWVTTRKPEIHSLKIMLEQNPVSVPGPHFCVASPGEQLSFTHPITGQEHRLTVIEYMEQEMDTRHFGDPNQEYPTHYHIMTYTVQPELPQADFRLQDCAKGDPPRQKKCDLHSSRTSGCSAIGIIGGSDGPTVLLLSGEQVNTHTTASVLHFEPQEKTEWRMVFFKKTREDISIDLM